MEVLGKDEVSEKRILVVDDEALVRCTLRDLVESIGYSCTEANSAQVALKLLKETHFPIVTLDIAMPEMDGLELLSLMSKDYPDVDVLIITGYEDEYSALKIVQTGASDYLAKPFTMEQLAAKLYKIEREKALKQKLYSSSITDELTGLCNRRFFYQKLRQEMHRAKRQGHSLSLIMFDVDGFKQFNDRYGHLKGDALLQTVASVLRSSLREHVDCACRYGGDEFVAIVPEADEKIARSIGHRIKRNFKNTSPGGLTLSMGVTQLQEDFDPETFVRLVDERMYRDKKKSKKPGPMQTEVDPGEDNDSIRCLNCGNPVDRAASICKNCLADPRKEMTSEKGRKRTGEFLEKPSPPTKDRRKAPRMRMVKTFLHDRLQATIQNISREGIQIKTKTPLTVGERLTIALALENRILRFGGIIIYVKRLSDGNSLAGLRFFEISDQSTEALNGFLDSHLPKTTQKESDK